MNTWLFPGWVCVLLRYLAVLTRVVWCIDDILCSCSPNSICLFHEMYVEMSTFEWVLICNVEGAEGIKDIKQLKCDYFFDLEKMSKKSYLRNAAQCSRVYQFCSITGIFRLSQQETGSDMKSELFKKRNQSLFLETYWTLFFIILVVTQSNRLFSTVLQFFVFNRFLLYSVSYSNVTFYITTCYFVCKYLADCFSIAWILRNLVSMLCFQKTFFKWNYFTKI